ncbi:YigZ family protein [Erysipelothrix sp. P66]|uniref:IMPACT family protein n=1 Tax=Erysipelothrix sp. P66 TaxID=3141531 RepID=UPI00315DB500
MIYNTYMEQLDYITIQSEVIAEQEINKSKFIGFLAPINSEEEAKAYLKSIKKMHPKATHHCSAYRTGEIERSNDDGEPASSAGLPMLQVLRGHKLEGVIAVVVRYYGGVLLGVGGLIRAYGSTVSLTLEEAKLLAPQKVYTMDLSFPYEFINEVELHITSVGTVLDRNYDSLARYQICVTDPMLLEPLNDLTRGTISKSIIKESIEFI